MAWIFAAFRRLLHALGFGGGGRAPQVAPAPCRRFLPLPPRYRSNCPCRASPRNVPAPVRRFFRCPSLSRLSGQFPTRGDGGTNAYFTTAMVQTFAGSIAAYGAPRAQGQTLPLSNSPSNQALFSLLGTTFGGNGMNSFGLPNLNGRVAIGGQQIGQFGQGTLTMTWLISTGPSTLAPVPGTLAMFASGWAPDGWMICDGSTLPISQYVPLFQAIGTAFGGNGEVVFQLPNLVDGAVPVGVGQGLGRAPVALGQQIAGPIPGLGLNYLISLEGPPPPPSGPGAFPDTGQYLGQVIAYAGPQAPPGWAVCDGSLMDIPANQPLFQLIGTSYGGDGKSNFALPDLRGLMVTGLAG